LLNALAKAFGQFDQYGFSAFQARWNALHAYANQEVQIIDHGQILQRVSPLASMSAAVCCCKRLPANTCTGWRCFVETG
jgi:biotin-(acetyl-CoA carboxylase) ligase